MRDYLNKNETLGYITLGAGLSFAQTLEETAEGKEKTYLKYIQTYMRKYQDEVCERLSDTNNRRIGKMVDTNVIKLVPATSPDATRITLNLDYLADIAELIIDAYCASCNGDNSDCEVREALKGCFIPECCTDKEKCCYCMGGYDGQK